MILISNQDGGRGQGTSETPGSSRHANGPSVLQEYKQTQKNRSGGKKKPKQVCKNRLCGGQCGGEYEDKKQGRDIKETR